MMKDIFKKKPRCRLKTVSDCRRFLAKTINDFRQELVTESEARTMGYLINILGQLIEKGDFEDRLKKLETQWAEQNENGNFPKKPK